MVEWSTVTIDKFTARTSRNKWQQIAASNTSWARIAASEIRNNLVAKVIPLFSKHWFRKMFLLKFRVHFPFRAFKHGLMARDKQLPRGVIRIVLLKEEKKIVRGFCCFFSDFYSSRSRPYHLQILLCIDEMSSTAADSTHVPIERYTFHSVPFPNTHQLVYHRSWVEPRVCK